MILLLFNLWSGATTIIGAQEILPKNLAVVCGITVQMMLFFLLVGWIMKESFFRKWLATLTFSALSIYTSFFCYYGILTHDINQTNSTVIATDAHQQLIASVYTPLQKRVITLEEEVRNLEELAVKEQEIGITTNGEIGCGPQCLGFHQKATDAKKRSNELNKQIESLAPMFEYDLDGLQPDEIYRKDRAALSAVPETYRNSYELEYQDYFDPLTEVDFLTPFNKVFVDDNREGAAIFAFLIALGVDGISMIQGTSLSTRKEEGTITFLFNRVSNLIVEWQQGKESVFEALGETSDIKWREFSRIVSEVNNNSGGKGIRFLTLFQNSIDDYPPHIINSSLFEGQNSSVFKNGFHQLREQLLASNALEYKASMDTEQWVVKREEMDLLRSWVKQEIKNLSNQDNTTRHVQESRMKRKFSVGASSNNDSGGWDSIMATFKNRERK